MTKPHGLAHLIGYKGVIEMVRSFLFFFYSFE